MSNNPIAGIPAVTQVIVDEIAQLHADSVVMIAMLHRLLLEAGLSEQDIGELRDAQKAHSLASIRIRLRKSLEEATHEKTAHNTQSPRKESAA